MLREKLLKLLNLNYFNSLLSHKINNSEETFYMILEKKYDSLQNRYEMASLGPTFS